MSLFETLPNSFRREAEPRNLVCHFQRGTRQWIFDEVHAWQSSKNPSRVFFILGQAGVGKSVFAAELVRRGNKEIGFGDHNSGNSSSSSSSSDQRVVAFHFFKYDDNRLRTARNFLLSVSAQLRKNLPGFRDAFDMNARDVLDTHHWTLEEYLLHLIAEPANAMMIQLMAPALVVVDALDECDPNDRDELARILKDFWPLKIPKWLTLLVTTRPSVMALPKTSSQAVEQGITVLKTEDKKNMHDVKLYLRDRVFRDCVAGEELEHFVEHVAEMSEGLFLYLRFLDEVINKILVKKKRKMLVAADLKRFPNGLGGVYYKYFARMYEELGAADYVKLFGSVVAAREPLPKALWMQTCGFDVTTLRRGGASTRAQWTAMENVCANLLHIPSDTETGGVRFLHKSMGDWLTGEADAAEETALKARLDDMHVGVESGDAILAMVCASIFFSDESQPVVGAVETFVTRHTFYHLCRAEEFERASRLLLDFNSLSRRLVLDTAQNIDSDFTTFFNVEFNTNEQAKKDGQIVAKVIRLGAAALRKGFCQLASQILGRLTKADVGNSVVLTTLRQDAQDYSPGVPWWRPANSFLESAAPRGALLRMLNGHTGWVTCVALSPDASAVVSGSADNCIRLWDTRTGEPKLGGEVLTGHRSFYSVRSVAFSPDGNTVASGSSDSTIMLWNANTGEPKLEGKTLHGHTDEVYSVAFSPNGKMIVSGSGDMTIRLWNATTGAPTLLLHGNDVMQGHTAGVKSVVFSPDGSMIASGSIDKTVRLWDAHTGEPKLGGKALRGHTRAVNSVAFGTTDKVLKTIVIISGSSDKTIRIWNPTTGEPELGGKPLKGHTGAVTSVAIEAYGNTIVSGSNDHTVRLWDVATGEPKLSGKPLGRHVARVRSVALSRDGSMVASGSDDNGIRLWDAKISEITLDGEVSKCGHTDQVKSVAFSPDGNTIATGACDKTIRLWDANTGEPKLGGEPLQSCYDVGGITAILSTMKDVAIKRLIPRRSLTSSAAVASQARAATNKAASMRNLTSAVWSLAFSPDGNTIASGSFDKTIRLWNANAGTGSLHGHAMRGHSACVSAVVFSPNGRTVVSGSHDCTIRLWDASTGRSKLDGHDKSLRCGGQALEGHTDWIKALAFCSDGSTIASGSCDKTVRLWNAKTGEPKLGGKALEGHTNNVHFVGFARDGNSLWSQDEVGETRWWDAHTGESLNPNEMGGCEGLGPFSVTLDGLVMRACSNVEAGDIGMTCDVPPEVASACAFRDAAGRVRCCLPLRSHKLAVLELMQ